MGISTIFMAIFNSYVSLPEGTQLAASLLGCFLFFSTEDIQFLGVNHFEPDANGTKPHECSSIEAWGAQKWSMYV